MKTNEPGQISHLFGFFFFLYLPFGCWRSMGTGLPGVGAFDVRL